MHRGKVLIVDDHAVVLQGLERLLSSEPDLAVVALATSTEQALSALGGRAVDLALVDVGLGQSCGLALVSKIRSRWPSVRILVLSMFNETSYAERALRAGANGYLMKSASADALVQAIRKVLAGGVYFSDRVEQIFYARLSGGARAGAADSVSRLSDRQIEVLRLIGEGLGSAEIAAVMSLSIKTIESHRRALRAKLGAKSHTELIRIAIAWQQNGVAADPRAAALAGNP